MCINFGNENLSETNLDSLVIKHYLDLKYSFNKYNVKQIKKKIIEIINDEDKILSILDNLDITYKYFIETLFINYPEAFTTSFANKYVKPSYIKYKDF